MRSVRSIFFLLLLIWSSGIFISFVFPDSSFVISSLPFTNEFYSNVCHQNPDKSFVNGITTLPVCARCTGIFAGALFISFILLFRKKLFDLPLKFLIAAFVPIILDVLFYNIGVYHYSKIAAFITGIFFGSILIIYILQAIELTFVELKSKRNV